jgi:hypothetical protein
LPGTNILSYWALSYAMKKMKYCEYDSRDLIHNTSFSS